MAGDRRPHLWTAFVTDTNGAVIFKRKNCQCISTNGPIVEIRWGPGCKYITNFPISVVTITEQKEPLSD